MILAEELPDGIGSRRGMGPQIFDASNNNGDLVADPVPGRRRAAASRPADPAAPNGPRSSPQPTERC